MRLAEDTTMSYLIIVVPSAHICASVISPGLRSAVRRPLSSGSFKFKRADRWLLSRQHLYDQCVHFYCASSSLRVLSLNRNCGPVGTQKALSFRQIRGLGDSASIKIIWDSLVAYLILLSTVIDFSPSFSWTNWFRLCVGAKLG